MMSLALTLLLSGLVQIGLGNPMGSPVEFDSLPDISMDIVIPAIDANPASTTKPLIHNTTCVCHAEKAHKLKKRRKDYHYEPGIGAHKLHTDPAEWNEARKICNKEGGHLAIVNSYSEAKVMKKLFAKAGPIKGTCHPNLAYIGIHDLYKEGEWVTITGESLHKAGFTRWSKKWNGQPDNGGGNQNCGAFLKEGDLDDVHCDMSYGFFCEIPI